MKFLHLPVAMLLTGLFVQGTTASAEEIPPEESLPCFPGAYYRKAVSSVDQWTGIEGITVMPTITFDPDRVRDNGRPMDNSSIYMGGRSGGQEIDAGVLWEIIREPDGSISTVGKAFRPFWRNNVWANAPATPEYYYYPGDVLFMSCTVSGPNELKMVIEVLERAPESPSQELSRFTTTFDAPGFTIGGNQEFKRVNAIDQYGNEGSGAQPTNARVDGGEWLETNLLRGDDRLPFTTARFTDMRCPNEDNIIVEQTDNADRGGERITIKGTPPENNNTESVVHDQLILQ
ncbi:MAG: hypothetical protein JJU11_15085 [Candidatus Sumerlaeia bacterium]|nr:hypothetical protein [Candidatus Sumerlaeia bacterium]